MIIKIIEIKDISWVLVTKRLTRKLTIFGCGLSWCWFTGLALVKLFYLTLEPKIMWTVHTNFCRIWNDSEELKCLSCLTVSHCQCQHQHLCVPVWPKVMPRVPRVSILWLWGREYPSLRRHDAVLCGLYGFDTPVRQLSGPEHRKGEDFL